jgi:hypothetical protein
LWEENVEENRDYTGEKKGMRMHITPARGTILSGDCHLLLKAYLFIGDSHLNGQLLKTAQMGIFNGSERTQILYSNISFTTLSCPNVPIGHPRYWIPAKNMRE